MRRALRMRDEGCRFPGCTNDKFVDGHHIEHWADGGETNLNNLVLLCRRHHHLVHEGGFSCEKTAGGELIFKDQRNTPLPLNVCFSRNRPFKRRFSEILSVCFRPKAAGLTVFPNVRLPIAR
jgi:hypothetical protein